MQSKENDSCPETRSHVSTVFLHFQKVPNVYVRKYTWQGSPGNARSLCETNERHFPFPYHGRHLVIMRLTADGAAFRLLWAPKWIPERMLRSMYLLFLRRVLGV